MQGYQQDSLDPIGTERPRSPRRQRRTGRAAGEYRQSLLAVSGPNGHARRRREHDRRLGGGSGSFPTVSLLGGSGDRRRSFSAPQRRLLQPRGGGCSRGSATGYWRPWLWSVFGSDKAGEFRVALSAAGGGVTGRAFLTTNVPWGRPHMEGYTRVRAYDRYGNLLPWLSCGWRRPLLSRTGFRVSFLFFETRWVFALGIVSPAA